MGEHRSRNLEIEKLMHSRERESHVKNRCKGEQQEFQVFKWTTHCIEESDIKSRWKHALGQIMKNLNSLGICSSKRPGASQSSDGGGPYG